MAGGIDWFRWHHGSVTDPKFQLIAKKAGVRLGDVMVVWAFVLENASANGERGTIGQIDFETLDFLLGADDGAAARILDAMTQRGLIDGSRIARWDVRQPKRERDPSSTQVGSAPAKTSTERSRLHRASKSQNDPGIDEQRHATPCNATDCQETPRGEESREEIESKDKPSVLAAHRGGEQAAPEPTLPPQDQSPAIATQCPHLEILALWAEILPELPQHKPEFWDGARADHLRARWRETANAKRWTSKAQGIAYFRKLLVYVGQSTFLTGRAAPVNGKRPFVIELEWLVNRANWAKVQEGKYHTDEVTA